MKKALSDGEMKALFQDDVTKLEKKSDKHRQFYYNYSLKKVKLFILFHFLLIDLNLGSYTTKHINNKLFAKNFINLKNKNLL
jgi:hypothetical protein